MEQLSQSWFGGASDALSSAMANGATASLLASFGTGVGAVPVLFTRQLSARWKTLLLSVGSGVMLSAAAFSLFLPALALAGASEVFGGLAAGVAISYGLQRILSPADLDQRAEAQHIWLFILAVALHHFPEGLAVGIGTEATHGAGIAVGVALQNLPEGLMVALALRQLGYGAGVALGLAAASGWLDPLGGWLGTTLVDSAIAPIAMALAAGAMLFVVLHELVPELNLKKLNSSGSVGLVTGLLAMAMVEQFLV